MNSSRPPLITVGIPAYNRPALLRETLASLAAQKDFTDFEIVVCDDLGLPETRAVIEASGLPHLHYHINPRRLGGVGNWNRCIAEARGTWVTILHEDDCLYPWFFASILPRLHPSLAAIAAKCIQGPTQPPLPPPTSFGKPKIYRPAFFLKGGISPFPGVVFARELALRLGGFDEKRGPLADYDFWYRLNCAGCVEITPDVSSFYRVSDQQWTATAWPDMLRRMHLCRLRVAREQMTHYPRFGRWCARYFTYRNARSYEKRFPEQPLILQRALRFKNIPLQKVPSGWVWVLLRWLAPATPPVKR